MTGPAFAALAAAISRNIPSDRAAELLVAYRNEVRAEAFSDGAGALDQAADLAEAEVLEHFNGACGKGSCDLVRESARTLREMATPAS